MAKDPNSQPLESSYIIAALAFGMIKTKDKILPGGTNLALASWIKTLKDQSCYKNSIIISQWEISNALKDNHGIQVDFSAVPKGIYLDTLGVIEQFVEYCTKCNIDVKSNKVLLVAHPEHFERCCLTMTMIGKFNVLNTKNDINPDWKQFGCDSDGYDPKSSQKWTRNKQAFIKHETKVMRGWQKKLQKYNDNKSKNDN